MPRSESAFGSIGSGSGISSYFFSSSSSSPLHQHQNSLFSLPSASSLTSSSANLFLQASQPLDSISATPIPLNQHVMDGSPGETNIDHDDDITMLPNSRNPHYHRVITDEERTGYMIFLIIWVVTIVLFTALFILRRQFPAIRLRSPMLSLMSAAAAMLLGVSIAIQHMSKEPFVSAANIWVYNFTISLFTLSIASR